jgi:hypothetical protein
MRRGVHRNAALFLAPLLTLAVAVSLAAPAGAAAAGADASPIRVTQAFFGALDRRDWSEACGLMLPGTRRWVADHDRSCPRRLLSAFRSTYQEFTESKHHWTAARVLDPEPPTALSTSTEVRFRLAETYRCKSLPRKPCSRKQRRFVRPERIYLLPDRAGRWRIAKLGAVLRDMELPSPQYGEEPLFPPADRSSLRQPAQLPPPPFPCSGTTIATVTDEPGDVEGPNYERISRAPWLDATSLEVVRTAPQAICVAVGLAEPPHPDSAYYVFWHPPEGQQEWFRWPGPNGQTIADLGSILGWGEPEVRVAIDGVGVPHVTINEVGATTQPSLARYLPRYGFAGGKLEIELTPRQGFLVNRHWNIFATFDAGPTWGDSLLRDSLSVEDRVPDDECVGFPSGKLVAEFFCQGPSG